MIKFDKERLKMLIEFNFSNFRSFKEEAVFSMEPVSQNGNEYNIINTNMKRAPQLYRSSGIFGANASGKSNIIRAFMYFSFIVKNSSKYIVDDIFPPEFYALTDGYDKQPMNFNIKFIVDDILYDYKFSLLTNVVQNEILYSYNISQTGSNRAKLVFERHYVDGKMMFRKSTGILQSWCNEVLNNRLLLSDIVNNRKCELTEIKNVYDFITKKIVVADVSMLNKGFSLNAILEGRGEKIINLVKKADLGLENIAVRNVPSEEIINMFTESKKEVPTKIKQALMAGTAKIFDTKSYHKTENGELKEFDFNEMESEGTEKFLSITGPVLNAIESGKILIIDEMDNTLHPYLVKYIVDLFNNPEINKNNAQLIFASHAYYLMDGKHLTRDQIWFVDKSINNGFSSSLYSLSDFKDVLKRKNTSFQEAYMDGVYGAVPNIKDF